VLLLHHESGAGLGWTALDLRCVKLGRAEHRCAEAIARTDTRSTYPPNNTPTLRRADRPRLIQLAVCQLGRGEASAAGRAASLLRKTSLSRDFMFAVLAIMRLVSFKRLVVPIDEAPSGF